MDLARDTIIATETVQPHGVSKGKRLNCSFLLTSVKLYESVSL